MMRLHDTRPAASGARGLRSAPRPSMLKPLAPVALLLALALSLSPEAAAQGPGAFARFGMGARAAVMGPQVADVFGGASPYHNPALAPFQPGQGVEISGALLSFDREWQAVQVGAPLRPRAGIAAGVVRGAVTGIDGRDESGYATGEFSTSDLGFFVAFGTQFSKAVSAGVGFRIYRSDLVESIRPPTALGVNAGLALRPTDRLAVGLAVEDLFAAYNWNASPAGGGTVKDRFPVRLRGGAAYLLGPASGAGRTVIAAEVETQVQSTEARTPGGIGTTGGFPIEQTDEADLRVADVMARVGVEHRVVEPLALRIGVDRLFLGDSGEIRPSAGFSVSPTLGELDLRIDYAATLEPFGTGVAQTATLRLNL
ncbi:hypothetical protein [Rubricoccus marinus]|uniref:PorV/PorQ family protein n=1 Tax=Rubricoccus marinus TaxID=716817 RepID=A0A259TX05_9BACT|nr:hypothetical protein [Rubricoccus marinus]OZC02157.1 hypothetical protein BSZ36_03645 [Rubricoccus marinus]